MSGQLSRTATHFVLAGAEATRAGAELTASAVLAPALALRPRGEAHCVLVIPGFLVGDLATAMLRRYLSFLGYEVHGWAGRINRGPTLRNVTALKARLAELADSSGGPVSVIGWSLGGHYAYQLGRSNPRNVRQIITLGAPARMGWTTSQVGSRLADLVPPPLARTPGVGRPWDGPGPLRVPVTAIYSRTDAVIGWRSCVVPPAPRRQNVQICSSHLGLVHNPAALVIIADRLSQPAGRWRPFRPPRGTAVFFSN